MKQLKGVFILTKWGIWDSILGTVRLIAIMYGFMRAGRKSGKARKRISEDAEKAGDSHLAYIFYHSLSINCLSS